MGHISTTSRASPASIGGRGLKRQNPRLQAAPERIARQYWRAWIETPYRRHKRKAASGIARQYWRAWIETRPRPSRTASAPGIARQYWRAWIETAWKLAQSACCTGIARQYWRAWIETRRFLFCERRRLASPASIGGRGLKPTQRTAIPVDARHRPPVLAGVD